ncbi:xyloglucan galactosyltransferase KATAMARI1 homolog [Hordeum vulgare subsp. vulgare]|uniref:xyloglucan galactosyltransferase KATAMARI1 homolog n=1 Tax=Hordeum vulgare subsp. vulgare TaxID=112509 RepID=UPI001D1A4625|nr:xyloglucan galactosyltransferase KATAMARI1 homolog [Hordeum vulgare subsp. vulgare]
MHLDDADLAARDALSLDLVDWLAQWRAMGGRDHFLVSGRGTWAFLRRPNAGGWGNALMTYPAVRNATPREDGYTCKSTFDAILADCIPVFFHPVSAYLQYTWHLPRYYRSYSVFIPADDLSRNTSIEEVLLNIPSEKVAQMREQVIRLIPAVMYRHQTAMGVTFKDAVDVALERVIHRVAKRRRAADEGREHVDGVDEGDSWKYDLLEDGEEKIGPHEFDQYLYMHVTKDLLA